MNRTIHRVAAIGAASCLTALSSVAVNAAHSKTQLSASPTHTQSLSKHDTGPALASLAATAGDSSRLTGSQPAIDRATHGRGPFSAPLSVQPSARSENIVRTALAYRGVPYRFGGRSAQSGFDCSGLVQAVCAKWGLFLPRAARAQFTRGIYVAQRNLRVGDLVFFKNTYTHGTSHVGVFIGDGKFVSAAGHGKGVRVSQLSDAFYQHHWAGARRFDLDRLPKIEDEAPVLASQMTANHTEMLELRGRMTSPEGLSESRAALPRASVAIVEPGPSTAAIRAPAPQAP